MGSNAALHAKNVNLESTQVKNNILKYLYSQINVNIKYEYIVGHKDLDNIRDNEYIICPRFHGTRSWIIFCQIGDIYYAVSFPKIRNYDKNIIIHPIEIGVTKNFYYGTIMEGIFFKIEDNRYLVIDEVYILAGQNQLLKSKDDRLNFLSQCMTNNIVQNATYRIYPCQYFQVNKKGLKELYEKIKADTKIQEISFYPKLFGRKIYKYTIIDSDLIDNIIKYTKFRMQKTNNPDVYNLLSLTTDNKIDIAYIPDMETSKKCKQWFKDRKKEKELVVRCQMNNDKKKWIPFELVENDIEDLEENDIEDLGENV